MIRTLTLSSEQLEEITGKVRWKPQIKALKEMGFVVLVRPDGFPLVDLEHYRLKMGGVNRDEPEIALAKLKQNLRNV